ncbi:MAG TPA: hypothetical protein VKX31_07680 [Brumimicrobium sp.]|nr:hypothetical protein [Brumimicrobium sp.]
MNLETIYVISDNKFGKYIAEWAGSKKVEVITTQQKNSELSDLVDGVVIFHENHNFRKEDLETQDVLNENNRAVHKVDLNGTLSATNSNFIMWLERNKPKSLLFLADDAVIKNNNLSAFLEGVDETI